MLYNSKFNIHIKIRLNYIKYIIRNNSINIDNEILYYE